MADGTRPIAGMTISIRSRRDTVIVDPDRFLAAARQAYRDLNLGLTEAEVASAVADVYDAVNALLDRHGRLAAESTANAATAGSTDVTMPAVPGVGRGTPQPGERAEERPDGLSPAGWLQHIVLDDPQPLQDYGCFVPVDPFALPGGTHFGPT